MWLIAGLGNPGNKYRLTRHNVGFMAIDAFLNSIGNPPEKKEHKSLTYSFKMESEKIIMAKPQTYMNDSGQALQALSHFYKVEPQKIIVLHDEIEIPFKTLKLQTKRGHGGQNGIRDIHQKLGTNDYFRIRIGVGRPDGKMDVSRHVLSPFSKDEMEELPDVLAKVSDGIESLIFEGFSKAATFVNSN
ncbi:MAG: aminoacyl-tRNA hydrolase [Bdellovibrionales bacterium]|nr:aminoacyl-tRNA hydrolase [Bdellovibrionales bacterium]NQZ18519.1 aminoacyl-tRNA hydrolase [Bdellovibrionales bacterium]